MWKITKKEKLSLFLTLIYEFLGNKQLEVVKKKKLEIHRMFIDIMRDKKYTEYIVLKRIFMYFLK
jgi:hypothetical protein